MKLNVGRCFEQAWDVFLKNWLILIVAGLLYLVLSVATVFILMGPLTAGLCLLSLNSLHREDRRVNLSDMFGMFQRFFGTIGLFFLTTIAVTLGLLLCAVPGLYLMTIWMFPFLILVDQEASVSQSLSRSSEMAFQAGFWNVVVLMLAELALSLLPEFVPFWGTLVTCVTTPFGFLVVAAAYRQLTTLAPSVMAEPMPELI